MRLTKTFSPANAPEQAGGANLRGEIDEGQEDVEEFLASLTDPEREELLAMQNSDHIYARLVQSIAPTVFGKPFETAPL